MQPRFNGRKQFVLVVLTSNRVALAKFSHGGKQVIAVLFETADNWKLCTILNKHMNARVTELRK